MQKQSNGSSVPLLIVVFVVLAVASLIGWRTLANNQQSQHNSAQLQSQKSNQQDQQNADPNAGYFVIKEWGVRFKLSGVASLQYTIGDRLPDVDGTVVFSTASLAGYGESCSAQQDSKAPLGTLTRTKAATQEFNSESGAFVKKVGDYYYRYTTPQSTCAEDLNQVPPVPLSEFKSSIVTLEAAK